MSLNINYRPQLLVGLVLALWLYSFLVLVGPFDASELSINIRVTLMLGYAVLFFLSYALLIPIQNKIFHSWGQWKLGLELAVITFYSLYCLPLCYAYYKTDIVNGDYSFVKFSLSVYLPIICILMPAIFVARYIAARFGKKEEFNVKQNETVTLLGENKLDIIKLPLSKLVAFEAANNYVAIYYILDGKLHKKLLRSSLRKMHQTVPEMIQVHRSYLINMDHFIEWQDGFSLRMTQLTVPVSQKYKSTLINMPAFAPK